MKIKQWYTPSLLIFWLNGSDSLDKIEVSIPVSSFSEFEVNNDTEYELMNILSFNNQENSFEMIKKQDSKWIGLAEGENISIDVEEFISVIPAIIKHPVMLVYQIHREIPKNKFSFDENSIPITYNDKEKQKQLEGSIILENKDFLI